VGGGSVRSIPRGYETPNDTIGQDKMIAWQYLFSSRIWMGPNGKCRIEPNGDGDGVMMSDIVAREIPFNFRLSDNEIDEVNLNQNTYVSEDNAIDLHGSTTKQKLTKDDFNNDILNSPFLKMFQYGQSHDGYWTNRHMKLQLEDVVDCLKVSFPQFDFLCNMRTSKKRRKKQSRVIPAGEANVNQ
jgi:hypothetical protein